LAQTSLPLVVEKSLDTSSSMFAAKYDKFVALILQRENFSLFLENIWESYLLYLPAKT
jgi:hypothetical protein